MNSIPEVQEMYRNSERSFVNYPYAKLKDVCTSTCFIHKITNFNNRINELSDKIDVIDNFTDELNEYIEERDTINEGIVENIMKKINKESSLLNNKIITIKNKIDNDLNENVLANLIDKRITSLINIRIKQLEDSTSFSLNFMSTRIAKLENENKDLAQRLNKITFILSRLEYIEKEINTLKNSNQIEDSEWTTINT